MSSGQYFEPQPAVSSKPGRVRLALPDLTAELAVDRGVFSSARIDPGTLILLRGLPPLPDGTVLDLGCGYGPIACTLAHRAPESIVWAVDVNQRALDLASANATSLGLRNVKVAAPDGVPAEVMFDAVVSNPPIKVGKEVLHAMLERWLPRLTAGGEAWLVVHRHLGSDSLAAWLAGRGWSVERVESKQGYRILRVAACAS